MSEWVEGLTAYGKKYGYTVTTYKAVTREEVAFYDPRDRGRMGPIANASKGIGGELYAVYRSWPNRTLVKNESNFKRHLREMRR